jgi:hypothetical protein
MKAADKKRGHKNKRAVIHETEQRVPYCSGVLTQEALTVVWLNDCPDAVTVGSTAP